MDSRPRIKNTTGLVIFLLLMILFTGCSNQSPTIPDLTSTPLASKSTPTPTPTPTPQILPTQTDCPPAGTARAAVMPPISLGNHTSLYYSRPTDTTLRVYHYDVTIGKIAQVISIPTHQGHGKAQVSPDGQWILFVSSVGLQMVRVDGQELQTLYCGNINHFLLSPDQKTLALTGGDSGFDLEMLDMISGSLLVNFRMKPDLKYYQAFRWRDNNSLYVMRTRTGIGGVGMIFMRANDGISLLKDRKLDSSSQDTNFQNMTSTDSRVGACTDYDIDQNQILTSQCTEGSVIAGPSTLKIQMLDNTASTIYDEPNKAILYARFASPTKILFFTENISLESGVPPFKRTCQSVAIWQINTDGTHLTQLATFPANTYFELNDVSPSTLDLVSHDGSYYAVPVSSDPNKWLVVGQFQNIQPSDVPGSSLVGEDGPEIVGWSTF